MTRRRKTTILLCVCVVFSVLIVRFALPVFWPAPRALDIDNGLIARIEPGMSEAEAMRMLGIPPGDYTTNDVVILSDIRAPYFPTPGAIARTWHFNSKLIDIWFAGGKVEHISIYRCQRRKTFIENVGWKVKEFFTGP